MNKLGFYLEISSDQNGLFDTFRAVRPQVVLLHNNNLNEDFLQINRQHGGPNSFVIGRWIVDNHSQERLLDEGDPAKNGRKLADTIATHNFGLAKKVGDNGRRLIDAWMTLNEVIPGPASNSYIENRAFFERRMRHYDAFQAAFYARLQEDNIEAVAFNFAAGNYLQPEDYLNHFPLTLDSYKYLGFHEYGWPHLNPNHTDRPYGEIASGAGVYRRCMEGIRERYGDRHVAIITELGLTKEYRDKFGFPRDERDANLGDLGWMNHTETLDEAYYFDALKWYNTLINEDEYVLGACLFEVGHSGRFRGHRHLGVDNNGNRLTIMDRVQALATAPHAPQASHAPQVPQAAPNGFHGPSTLRGQVQRTDGQELHNAVIRLVGNFDTMGSAPQSVLSLPMGEVIWDRTSSTVTGDRWSCYQKSVAQQVAGLPYARFKDLVVEQNPTLVETDYEFVAGQSYYLPRNRNDTVAIQWDRTVSGFSGNRWVCWQKFVAGRVLGLTWSEFSEQVLLQNPHLAEDDGHFQAHKAYSLPSNPSYQQLEIFKLPDENGYFSFSELSPGDYMLRITERDSAPLERRITLLPGQETALELTLPRRGAQPAFQAVDPENGAAKETVRVHNGRFFLGDQPFPRFAGVNLPHLLYLDDHDVTHPSDISLAEYLDKTQELGARVVRTFIPHHHYSDSEIAARLRPVLEALNARGMYLIPVLVDLYQNVGAFPQAARDYYVGFHDGGESTRLGPEFFTTGYQSQGYQSYLRTILQSVPIHLRHTIFAWEIGNELKMEHPGVNPPHTKWGDPERFVDFCQQMAATIKEINPHNHLVSTGMISTQHAYLEPRADLRQQLYAHPAIDFLSVHVYYGDNAGDPEQMRANNKPDLDAVLARSLQKPIVVGEAGILDRLGDFRRRLGADIRRWLQDAHFDGQERQRAAGYMIWCPPYGLMGSGELYKDRGILLELLRRIVDLGPAFFAGNGHRENGANGLLAPAQLQARLAQKNKLGIDLNRPITGRQPSEVVSNPQLIAEIGVTWVRLNFVLQDASSPEDVTWQSTYNKIINDFQTAGMQIYGLIGGEAVKMPIESRLLDSVQQKTNNGTRADAEEWVDEYERNFLRIVQLFGDRVTHFESYNEPDNYSIPGVPAAVVHPTWFAHILHRVYQSVKPAFPHIQLISGPLLGHYHHQPTGMAAANYLRQTYEEGRTLGWHASGQFPFDGVGYHLYLKPNQQSDFVNAIEHPEPMDWETHAQRVRIHYNVFTRALLQVVRANEGAGNQKRLFISEMGWDSSENSETLLDFQARSVTLALQLLMDDSNVELGFWFCTRDFTDNNKGLFRSGLPLAQAHKPAFHAFQRFTRRQLERPEPLQATDEIIDEIIDNVASPIEESPLSMCAVPPTPEPVIRPGLLGGQQRAVLMFRKKWVSGTVLRYYFFDKESDGTEVLLAKGTRQWRGWAGTEAQKETVRRAFQIWKDVGIGLEFKEVRHRGEAEIRIGFQRGDGHWSYVGRDIIDLVPTENDRTMNLDWHFDFAGGGDTALHEIGHTLGLTHEHQNPKAGLVWDQAAVHKYFSGSPNFWDSQTIEANIIRKLDLDEVQGSRWDPDSIMHYSFPPGIIKEPPTYANGLDPAPGLSDRDRQWALTFYPPTEAQPPLLPPFTSQVLALHTGEQTDFIIEPEATRTYTFRSFGRTDVVMVLFEDVDGEPRYVNGKDDSAVEENAQMEARLWSGRRYILRIRSYYNTGSQQVAVMYW